MRFQGGEYYGGEEESVISYKENVAWVGSHNEKPRGHLPHLQAQLCEGCKRKATLETDAGEEPGFLLEKVGED